MERRARSTSTPPSRAREVEECIAWSGARPVQWLLDNMDVDPRWCLIHCTHMTADESTRLARSGAVAGLCPITEANLGDGIFAAPPFAAAGGRFAIGTDSNVRIALNEELRTLEYGQRLREEKRNRLGPVGASTGRHLFDTRAPWRSAGAGASDRARWPWARRRTSSFSTTLTRPSSARRDDQLIDCVGVRRGRRRSARRVRRRPPRGRRGTSRAPRPAPPALCQHHASRCWRL